MVRKEYGTIKLLVYRKKTYTDQYLNFSSHHPLHQKLGIIKTLLDRCNNIVTDQEDRRKEEEYISMALQECGYPKWTIRTIREKQQNQQRKSKEKNKEKFRCMVTLQVVTEPVQRILKHHDVTSAVRPHRNLRQILMHPKNKVEDKHKTDCLYQIPFKTCNVCYVGETGRTFGTRLEEHKKEVETVTSRRFTREARKSSTNVEHKSAITDHADRSNCVLDWEVAKVVDKDTNRCARWIKEAIWIRKTKPTMNKDEGGYRLSHVWDSLLATPFSEQ